MGTEIIDEDGIYVKRIYGGIERGTCFILKIDKEFTQKELCDLLSRIINGLIVKGEGKETKNGK